MEFGHVIKYFMVKLVYKIKDNLKGKMKIIKEKRNMVCIKDIHDTYNVKMI